MTSDETERSPLAQIIGMIPNCPPSGFHTEPNSEGPLLTSPSKAQTVIKTKSADMREDTYTADAFNQIGVFLLSFKFFSCFCSGERILPPLTHYFFAGSGIYPLSFVISAPSELNI